MNKTPQEFIDSIKQGIDSNKIFAMRHKNYDIVLYFVEPDLALSLEDFVLHKALGFHYETLCYYRFNYAEHDFSKILKPCNLVDAETDYVNKCAKSQELFEAAKFFEL